MKNMYIKNMYKRPMFYILVPVIFFFSTAMVFAQEDRKGTLINMQTIPLDDVETLTITSQAGFLILLESENDCVVVKEYRDDNGKRNNTPTVDVRPFTSIISSDIDPNVEVTVESVVRIMPFQADGRIEVYIPASYRGVFQLTATGGMIRSEMNLNSGRQVDITVTNGDLELKRVSAGLINIAVSSGSFQAEKLAGAEINIRHTSGRIEIGEALGLLSIEALSGPITVWKLTGGGSIVTQAGTIDVGLYDAIDDFSCILTTGSITITTPSDLFYNLDAETQRGAITVTPPGGISPISTHGSVRWTFGKEGNITISAKVSTGSITIGHGED
jgi:DUF4097 and DUF4098 domain-containing protein YvlB